MSGRTSSRQRSKSARAQAAEEAATAEEDDANEMLASRKKRKRNIPLKDRSETPNSRTGSRLSTPASSRGGSRSPTPTPKSEKGVGRRKSAPVTKSTPVTKSAKKAGRRIGSGNGSLTNSRRASSSRSSSVASNTKILQPSRGQHVPAIKLKIKKSGRGYNPSLVNYKESEYHYGSDFDEDADSDEKSSKSEDSSDEESESANEQDDLLESDVEFDAEAISRPSTPVPFWLRTDEDVPELHLPPSSGDILIPDELLLKTCSVYEVLRHYSLLLRLSPFRIEDFCAALSSEEQSNLLSEVHVALLKSIVRAEERDGTQFGPLDCKDSTNCILYFMDTFTWPESLKLYLYSDPIAYAAGLEILLKNREYPFASSDRGGSEGGWIENRVAMLSYLADQFLTTNAVRDDIQNEGRQAPEDHCRICHRLGDMVVCEQCSGIYHLTCLDPPLDDVPEDDWHCYVCQANEVSGVTDTLSEKEKVGELHRHESLGIDRAGNKYWFICRRLIVEKREGDGVVAYYTTIKQFEELMRMLDADLYEHDLVETIESIQLDIEEHMRLTETLTQENKPSTRPSYLELENVEIEKVQNQRDDLVKQEQEDKKQKENEKEHLVREEQEKKRKEEEAVFAAEEERKKKEREERLKKREEKRGDTWIAGDDDIAMTDPDLKTEIKEEEDIKEDKKQMIEEVVTTTTTTTSTSVITTQTVNEIKDEVKQEIKEDADIKSFDKKPGDSLLASIINKPTTRAQTGSLPAPKQVEDDKLNELRLNERLTRSTLQHITSGTMYFKLGQEQSYKSYVNQYTSNPSALTKMQTNEERVKRTHMSHKFSLTDAFSFKWIGTLYGGRTQLVNTLRQTMIQVEKEIPVTFMHPNWTLLRKPWVGAVSQSVTPRDFARALTVIKCCIKPCLMLNVWKESLGHTQFKKITSQMREDKKKLEKRERREREEDDERLRPWMTFVKYTLGLKHQVSKQRGEEYRAHGQNGWLWLSSSRNFSPSDSNKLGLRAGAFRLAVKYTDIRDSSYKIVLMEPKAFNYLLNKQEDMEDKGEEMTGNDGERENVNGLKKEEGEEKEIGKDEKLEKPTIERKKLEQALKNARLEWQAPKDEMFEEVVDVQAGLSNPTRILYPKVAKKTKVLDDLLSRRFQLKQLEERRIELKTGIKPVAPTEEGETKKIQTIEKSKNEDGIVDVEGESDTKTSMTSNLAPSEANDKNVSTLSKPSKALVSTSQQSFCEQTRADISAVIAKLNENTNASKQYRPEEIQCYSTMCNKDSNDSCYSITCKHNKSTSYLVEAAELYTKIIEEARSNDFDIPETSLNTSTKDEAVEQLQNLLNVLSAKTISSEDNTTSTSSISTITMTTSSATTTTASETTTVTKINGEIDSIETSKFKTTVENKSKSEDVSDAHGTTSIKEESVHSKTASTEEKISNDGDVVRIYSSTDTTGRLYLKRIQSIAESKKQGKVVRYPLAPNFYSKSRKKRNILLLAKHDVKHMARKFGTPNCEGFNYNAKGNNQIWPYPCPRPLFHTTWSYRTSSAESIQAVGLQLKILWACVRWDDMNSKPLSVDGKHRVTTDNAITTREILKHRNTGRFLERTQYFQRKVTIPLNVPSRPRASSPIRSGLRKRKRAESPTQSEPQLTEAWIDEYDLDLWELRAYRDRLEREKFMSMTRTKTGTVIRGPDRLDPVTYSNDIRRKEDMGLEDKDELERGYRKDPCWKPDSDRLSRRENSFTKRYNKVYDPNPASPASNVVTTRTRPSVIGSNSTPTIIRRITNPDGSISVVRSTGIRPIAPTLVTSTNSGLTPISINPPAKKVFISKDGKIIGTQLVQQTPNGPRIITPGCTTTTVRPGVATTIMQQAQGSSPGNISGLQTPPATGSPQQKVQIVRSADGKIQVRGLLPGQQLVQMPDGRLQIFSSPASSIAASPSQTTPGPSRVVLQSSQPQQLRVANQLQSSTNASNVMLSGGTTTKIISGGATTGTTNQIIATQLPPGAQIPAGMTAFVSGGKTYCIPKATTAMAQQQPTSMAISSNTPSSIISTISGSLTTSTLSKATIVHPPQTVNAAPPPQATPPKQMVEVKALGPNVVTFKGNQMIVSGPDVQQAQLIAKQLSTGAARLATLGGKQVLISTSAVNAAVTSTPIKSTGEGANSSPVFSTANSSTIISGTPSAPLQQQSNKQAALQGTPMMNSLGSSPSASHHDNAKVMNTSLSTSGGLKEVSHENSKGASNTAEANPLITSATQLPTQVTAQLIQTSQGPRIILQGIQGSNIPKEQLAGIQQQVKNQLLKAQAEAKRDGKVPPTKIVIQLPPSMQAKLQPETAQPKNLDMKDEIKPSSTLSSQPPSQQQQQAEAINQPVPVITAGGDNSQILGAKPVMLQQHQTPGIPGQKVIVMNHQKVGYATPIVSLSSSSNKPQPNTSLLLSSLQNSKPRLGVQNPTSLPISQNQQGIKMITPTNTISNSVNSENQLGTSSKANSVLAPSATSQTLGGILANQMNQIDGTEGSGLNEGLPNHIPKISCNSIDAAAVGDGDDKFELTPDYIQKAISDALKTQNLSPEIEQKLLALQEHNDKSQHKPLSRRERKNAIDPETGETMDDEWDPYGTKTRYIRKKMEQEKSTLNQQEISLDSSNNSINTPVDETEIVPNIRSNDTCNLSSVDLQSNIPEETMKGKSDTPSTIPVPPPKPIISPKSGSCTSSTTHTHTKEPPRDNSIKPMSSDEKKRHQLQNKLQQMLHKHKELLKKDIAKKRAMQEKELQIEIHREIENLKRMHNVGRIDTSPTTKGSECHIPQEQFRSPAGAPRASSTPVPDTRHQKSHPQLHEGLSNDLHNTYGKEDGSSRKRRRQSSGDTPAVSSTHHSASSSIKKRKNSSSGSGTGSRRDRVYCICRKKYDPTKFYVGCDVCNEWFHGNCVGITEAMSKDMTEFICDACSKARDNQEIFCLCKQPYDETQFYIGCEGCPDWYHGRCVGILQSEAGQIDEYFCPRCSPNSELNRPNLKLLNAQDYDLVKKLIKQLLGSRYAAAFKEPVNPNEVPNYYQVVKVPMDLQTIDQRVSQKYYKTLSEFIGDVMRIFENCRFFNPKNSPINKNADNLESFFTQKLALLREKVVSSTV